MMYASPVDYFFQTPADGNFPADQGLRKKAIARVERGETPPNWAGKRWADNWTRYSPDCGAARRFARPRRGWPACRSRRGGGPGVRFHLAGLRSNPLRGRADPVEFRRGSLRLS